MDELFSSTINRAAAKKKGRSKKEIAPIELPRELAKYSDLFAAGKSVLKELEFKVKYADQRLREFCNENYIRLFAALKTKPPSLDYVSKNSSLKYVQTHRTSLTHEKIEQLRELDISVDEYTELVGIDINMAAIRQHKLEKKLQEGLASLGVSQGIIEECFMPKHELNEGFIDKLYTIVQGSLKNGEEVAEKMIEVFEILNPSSQIRNVETKLTQKEAFDFTAKVRIDVDDNAEDTEAA